MAQDNNKIGISLLQPSSEDIVGASHLINGNSGDWGYVTIVIQENDRDVRKWQDIFEQFRERHLIPIVRLATSPQGEVWRRPEEKDVNEWVDFLGKLNWVIKKRYIILFNEPNHASEWGGEVSPEGYGTVVRVFAKTLKASNTDYFVMLAGLDGAAPQIPSQYWDSGEFMKEVCKDTQGCSDLFKNIDGWTTHSYPNPGFSGSVWDTGKKSIRGYEYELALLKELGIEKNLPVFITETGWKEGILTGETIAENYKIGFTQVWGQDPRVQAVTPFVYKYLSEPFLGFSWIKNNEYSAQYSIVKDLPKAKGSPEQLQKGVIGVNLPSTLIARSTYHFSVSLINQGQAIWNQNEGYTVAINSTAQGLQTLIADVQTIKPFEEDRLSFTLKTPSEPQTMQLSILLKKGGKLLLETKLYSITVEPFPELSIKTSIFPKFTSNGDNFEIQLFDKEEELVFSKKGLSMRKGIINLDSISNIIPGEKYRVVLLGYPYIPRQTIIPFKKGKNNVAVKTLLPFDTDGNGKWDLNDIKTAVMNPSFLLRFIPWYQL